MFSDSTRINPSDNNNLQQTETTENKTTTPIGRDTLSHSVTHLNSQSTLLPAPPSLAQSQELPIATLGNELPAKPLHEAILADEQAANPNHPIKEAPSHDLLQPVVPRSASEIVSKLYGLMTGITHMDYKRRVYEKNDPEMLPQLQTKMQAAEKTKLVIEYSIASFTRDDNPSNQVQLEKLTHLKNELAELVKDKGISDKNKVYFEKVIGQMISKLEQPVKAPEAPKIADVGSKIVDYANKIYSLQKDQVLVLRNGQLQIVSKKEGNVGSKEALIELMDVIFKDPNKTMDSNKSAIRAYLQMNPWAHSLIKANPGLQNRLNDLLLSLPLHSGIQDQLDLTKDFNGKLVAITKGGQTSVIVVPRNDRFLNIREGTSQSGKEAVNFLMDEVSRSMASESFLENIKFIDKTLEYLSNNSWAKPVVAKNKMDQRLQSLRNEFSERLKKIEPEVVDEALRTVKQNLEAGKGKFPTGTLRANMDHARELDENLRVLTSKNPRLSTNMEANAQLIRELTFLQPEEIVRMALVNPENFRSNFLQTYRMGGLSSEDLFQHLGTLIDSASGGIRKQMVVEQAYYLIQKWATEPDINRGEWKALLPLLAKLPRDNQPNSEFKWGDLRGFIVQQSRMVPLKSTIYPPSLRGAQVAEEERQIAVTKLLSDPKNAPATPLTEFRGEVKKALKLSDSEFQKAAEEFGNSLTERSVDIYKAMKPQELEKNAWEKPNRYVISPNIVKAFEESDRVSTCIRTTILGLDTPQEHTKAMKFFVRAAQNCKDRNDFHSMTIIATALNSGALQRVVGSLEGSPEALQLAEMGAIVLSMQKFQSTIKEPFIPFVGALTAGVLLNKEGTETPASQELSKGKLNPNTFNIFAKILAPMYNAKQYVFNSSEKKYIKQEIPNLISASPLPASVENELFARKEKFYPRQQS